MQVCLTVRKMSCLAVIIVDYIKVCLFTEFLRFVTSMRKFSTKGTSMSRILTIIVILCFVFPEYSFADAKFDKEMEEILIETSKKINSQLPMMVDPDTRLDVTMCFKNQLHFKYTMVNYTIDELDIKDFHNGIEAMLTTNQCKNENMVKMLKVGIEYYYIYLDKNGILITTVNIDKRNCDL
jgi:hypothetical protein